MKIHASILFVLMVFMSVGQKTTTVTGYIEHFFHTDPVKFTPETYSVETYDKQGERIYYHRPNLWEKDKSQFERTVKKGHYQTGFVKNNDTAIYTYITDSLNLRRYIIYNNDTQFVYELTYENKKIASEKCIKGGEYTNFYFYEPGKTRMETRWPDQTRSYGYEVFDEKHRSVLWNSMMRSPDDTLVGVKNIYDDKARTKITIYGGSPKMNGEIVVYTYDKNSIPVKLHYRHYNDGVLNTEIKVRYKKTLK
ncbi:MAG TPA: hypothetical protein VK177_12170 [Flavobacteriales bacterium]|nr:hypothetical protein [Flavobacteriales bacterium]